MDSAATSDDSDGSAAPQASEARFSPDPNEAWPPSRLESVWGLICSLHDPQLAVSSRHLLRVVLARCPATEGAEGAESAIARARAALAWAAAESEGLAHGTHDARYRQQLVAEASTSIVAAAGDDAPLIAHARALSLLRQGFQTLSTFALDLEQALDVWANTADGFSVALRLSGEGAITAQWAQEVWSSLIAIADRQAPSPDAEGATPAASSAAPASPDDPEFAIWVGQQKAQFTARQAFNVWLCDQIAATGTPPNPALVLRLGRWGSAQAVAEDVRVWAQQAGTASQRLDEQRLDRLRSPQPLRSRALELIDEIWELAQAAAEQSALQAGGYSSAQFRQVIEFYIERQRQQAIRTDAMIQQIQEHQAQIERLDANLQTAMENLERAQAIAKRNEQSLQELQARAQQLAAEKQAAAAAHARDLEAQSATHEARAQGLRHSIALLESQLDSVRRESAAHIDRARQDARAAQAREAQERERSNNLQAELIQVQLTAASERTAAAVATQARQDQALRDKADLLGDLLDLAMRIRKLDWNVVTESTFVDLADEVAALVDRRGGAA